MEIKLNDDVLKVIDILESHSYLAYVVGSYIRDSLMNITPSDIDLVTDATLEEIRFIFSDCKIVDYKKNSLTLGIVYNKTYIEISTFDGKNLEEDLLNRDFKINAIAYSPTKGLIDPLNGKKDVEDKIIRTPKAPIISICKDPFRIIKAISLSINKSFTIDKELKDVILTSTDLLKSVNPARFKKFLDGVMLSKKPSLIIEEYFEVFSSIIPALKYTYKFDQHSKYHNLDVFNHIMKVLDFTSPNLVLRYAAFFHDIEKPQCYKEDEFGEGHFYNHAIFSAETAKFELTNLNYSKDFINKVYKLVYYHDFKLDEREVIIKKLIEYIGKEDLDLFFELKKCDCLGQNPELYGRIKTIDKIKEKTLKMVNPKL